MQVLGNHIGGLLLVDEDDNGCRELAAVEDLQHTVPTTTESAPASVDHKPRYVLLLFVSIDELDPLFDGVNRTTSLTNRNDSRPLEVLLRQSLDRRRHRSGEQGRDTRPALLNHCLAVDVHLFALVLAFHGVGGQLVEDEREVRLETQVDHPVGFVHDDVATLGEDDDVPLDDVLQTTGRGDDDLCAGPQVELLLFYRALSQHKMVSKGL